MWQTRQSTKPPRASVLTSQGPGGTVIRRLLPTVVGIMIAVAFLRWTGAHQGLYGDTVGLLLMTTVTISVITGLLWYFAGRLDRDDARRRSAELQLERRSRYFDLSHDLVCTAGHDGVFTQVNAAWTQTLGWSEEELCSRPFTEFVHPDDRQTTEQETAGLTQGGVTVDFLNRYATKDGDWRWLDWKAVAVPEDGVIYASARDVTARKAAEAAEETSRAETRQILETAHDAFVAIDADGMITDWNPQAEVVFGWSRREALNRELAELIVPEAQRDAHRRGIAHFLATGEGPVLGQRIELTALHRDGRELPVELTISALQTERGHTFNAFLRDISERVAANDLLERQRRQMSQAQGVGQFGSWEWDISANTTEWSDELYRIYGLVPDGEPVTFEDFIALVHPDDRAAVQEQIRTAYESCEPFFFDHRITRPDGEVRVLQARGEVVTGEDGTPLRMLGTGQDITARHDTERAKDEFVSIVSHELRTPLTSIRGSLGLLAGGVLAASPEKAERMLKIAVDSTDRLVRLINDLLDIERINSGTTEIERRPCDAEQLVQDAADAMDAAAAEAGVTLHVSSARVAVWADPDRVAQTLTNLLSNAIKFSPRGGRVWLAVEEREGELRFSVRDEGRGIPVDKLELVFERFQQVDSSDARDKGGTGLGLAICRSIVEQHGGRIWVQSVAGLGSTFTFTLPTGLLGAEDRSQPAVPYRPRILICDDDPGVREVTGALLEQQGYEVISAASGREAITFAKAKSPNAILLDIFMPGMSGWDTALALSQSPDTRDIPIVIMSGLPADLTTPSPVVVIDWIGKPVDEKTLFEALDRALARQRTIGRVLVVEDDLDLASVLLAVFERHGVEAVQARSGTEAVALCRDLQPDMLVLDVGLPGGDGFSVVDWLRQNERMRNVPIVVYTARDLSAAERRRLDMGRTRFMTKGTVTLEHFERDVLDFLGAVAPRAEAVAGDQ